MKTKFKQSDITISGLIQINYDGVGHPVYINGSKGKIKSGVYCLRNKLHPERYYIGMARNLETRFQHHISDLKLGKHKNTKLLEDFIAAGFEYREYLSPEQVFEMEVIIYCRPSQLEFYENILINSLNPYYNIHKIGGHKVKKEITEEEANEILLKAINNQLNAYDEE